MVLVVRQAQMLVALYDMGGELSTTELARALQAKPQHVAQIARSLQEQGLLRRERRGTRVIAKLTEKGRQAAPLVKQLLEKLQPSY